MDCSDSEDSFTPPELEETAKQATYESLPGKSRKLYEKQYDDFKKWCKSKGTQKCTENILLAYFFEKSKTVKCSTMWSYYSMLKSMILVKDDINITKFSKLIAFLKRKNDGYTPKKSKILTAGQVEQFLKEAADERYLLIKVALIFGVAGACRGDELLHLAVKDVEEMDNLLLINIRNTKNKHDRSFIVKNSGENPINYLQLCKKYMSLRKHETDHSRFFVHYRNNKCTTQPVGKNYFAKIPQNIATFLKLSDVSSYTGHCFRRTSASLLTDAGANVDILKRHGGWKSATVAEGYVERSISNKTDIAEKIFKNVNDRQQSSTSSFNKQHSDFTDVTNISSTLSTCQPLNPTSSDQPSTSTSSASSNNLSDIAEFVDVANIFGSEEAFNKIINNRNCQLTSPAVVYSTTSATTHATSNIMSTNIGAEINRLFNIVNCSNVTFHVHLQK